MRTIIPILVILMGEAMAGQGTAVRLASRTMVVEVDSKTGGWWLADQRSGVRWPSESTASPGHAPKLAAGFAAAEVGRNSVRLTTAGGAAVAFELADRGRTLVLRYEGDDLGDVKALDDALAITDAEGGCAVVPCREGLLIPADSGKSFKHAFGSSDYEGCHMNMLGFLKAGSALVVDWDDAYTFPELQSVRPKDQLYKQRLTATFTLRRTARTLRLTPLGKGGWDTIAAGYRRIAEAKGLAATLADKIDRNPHAELLVGASNVKLWTCLARKMNEESTAVESEKVRWTFAEAAQIAEHIRKDLDVDHCLFMIGGWTEGGYDVRHPDALPANPECGGNRGLAAAVRRIQKLGYVACLHDNYQDMYRDAKSWDEALIEKDAAGSLVKGGRWLGGRAYMVCAPNQLLLAQRPQNLPAVERLFGPWSYFIDTTYAVGPRECHDPGHPIGRNDDIAWKAKLSDYARGVFGLFGSECGREWALAHSDFFEGLVGVSGRAYHSLDPASLGATVIPFWEMVYHDCQIAWGKYGYKADEAGQYVAHHVLCARPLHYHSVPDHLYWKEPSQGDRAEARPRVAALEPQGARAFRIRYAWDVGQDVGADWRVFVHFGTPDKIRFQDDYVPKTSAWRKGQTLETEARTVTVPATVRDTVLNVYIGLFDLADEGKRASVPGCDGQRRVLVGRLHLKPELRFEPAGTAQSSALACFTRSDGGWAEGMHPMDAFLKNTHEVLGPLHRLTARERLTRLEFLTPDRAVRRATYGTGPGATKVVVNFGQEEARVRMPLGGDVALPAWGFAVEGPGFAAFYATRWGGQEYPGGALFTLQSTDGEALAEAQAVRIFHGFGDPTIPWKGKTHAVAREATFGAGS